MEILIFCVQQSTSKNEKYLLSRYKRKRSKDCFKYGLFFVTPRLRMNSIKIFCWTNRITIKTYDTVTHVHQVIAQKYSSPANLQWTTSFELCLKMLHLQKQPFKQLINFSHTLDKLDTLNKFSFTFRSSCSLIMFKIDSCLKIFQYLQENTFVGVSF